jgi:methylated-DNA-protein-cysteine methyltransferase-like protein
MLRKLYSGVIVLFASQEKANAMDNDTSPTAEQANELSTRVFALVQACPVGRVTTYGWIAKAVGYPRGARMIGWIMHETPQGVPAQRVINSKGELSGSWAFGQKGRMRQLLEAEGVTFTEDSRVDLKRYGWNPSQDLSEEELKNILEQASTLHYEISPRVLGLLRDDPASPWKS